MGASVRVLNSHSVVPALALGTLAPLAIQGQWETVLGATGLFLVAGWLWLIDRPHGRGWLDPIWHVVTAFALTGIYLTASAAG